MKSSKIKVDLSKFEFISEATDGKLLGGFSASFEVASLFNPDGDGSNNCNGGNCVAECGKGQNVNCNTVAGCGSSTIQ